MAATGARAAAITAAARTRGTKPCRSDRRRRQSPHRSAGGRTALDINDLPLDDSAAYALIKAQRTTAIFQLESSGMKDLIRRLQPDCFEDIVALVALFRPGPLQSGMVDDFIDRKHGRAAVVYPHPDLEPILRPTYGVILYQEQVMQIAQVLAGYSLGGADLLRRAMGKKKPEEMAKQRAVFTAGALSRGVEEATATRIFDLMEKFAGYGFNKSHSAAYALVSYQTAWLKAHHPAAFMAAVLSSDMDNTDKVVVFVNECRQLGLPLQPPSINDSDYRFTVAADGHVVYGLGAVKGVGASAIQAIVEERRLGGAFTDLFDLCQRVDLQKANRRVMESLIRAGALDCFGGGRAAALARLPEAFKLADQHSRNCATGQDDLFGLALDEGSAASSASASVKDVPEWDEAHRLRAEKEALGLYLTGHPIESCMSELEQYTSGRISEVTTAGERDLRSARRGRREKRVVVAGLVGDVRERVSQRGGRMAFVTLEDREGRIEARLFGEVFEQYGQLIVADEILVVEGQLVYEEFSDSIRLNAKRLLDLDGAREAFGRRIVLALESDDFGNGFAVELEEILKSFGNGLCPVIIDYRSACARARLALDESWTVRPVQALIERLRDMLGDDRVRLHWKP